MEAITKRLNDIELELVDMYKAINSDNSLNHEAKNSILFEILKAQRYIGRASRETKRNI